MLLGDILPKCTVTVFFTLVRDSKCDADPGNWAEQWWERTDTCVVPAHNTGGASSGPVGLPCVGRCG